MLMRDIEGTVREAVIVSIEEMLFARRHRARVDVPAYLTVHV